MNPATLTGAEVRRVREAQRPRISRRAFADMIGRTPTRVFNIEEKDSWKPGDREAVAAVLAALSNGEEPDAGGAVPGVPPGPEGETLPASVDLLDVDEDELVRFLDVLREHDATLVLDATPLPVYETDEPEPAFIDVLTVSPTGEVNLDPALVFTNSQVQAFKRCRRKWWLGWYRGLHLRARNPLGVREIGDRVHRALAAYYVPDGTPRTDPREALERLLVQDWTAYVATLDGAEPGEQVARDFTSEAVTQRAMISGYVEWLAETGEDEALHVIAPERFAEAELYVAEDERPVRIAGRFDVQLRRATDGVRLFMDHKTVGDLTQPARTLHMDEQMLHYHLLEFLGLEDADERCDGALYNMLRRSKRTDRARPPFFGRLEVHHNAHELDSYAERLGGIIAAILQARHMLDEGLAPTRSIVYPSPRRECTWDCEFFAVCPLLDDGSRAEDMLTQWYAEGDPMGYYEPRLLT